MAVVHRSVLAPRSDAAARTRIDPGPITGVLGVIGRVITDRNREASDACREMDDALQRHLGP